jgi:energy-coupling factor transporter ATP-binding protein EcfA2
MDDCLKPLRPLRELSHAERYRPIDNYAVQFEKFIEIFNRQAAWIAKGHLFVVTGDRGYGKTSLMQRCAYWMTKERSQDYCEVIVVDISDEDWRKDDSEMRRTRVRDWILRELTGPLERDIIKEIYDQEDLLASFQILGHALSARKVEDIRRPIVLIVLLPGYPTPDELREYYRISRPGMVFFAEMFDERHISFIANNRMDWFKRAEVDAHLLQMGVLNPGDQELVTTWLQENLRNCPDITDPQVLQSLSTFLKNQKIGISALMSFILGAVRCTHDARARKVELEHIMANFARDRWPT